MLSPLPGVITHHSGGNAGRTRGSRKKQPGETITQVDWSTLPALLDEIESVQEEVEPAIDKEVIRQRITAHLMDYFLSGHEKQTSGERHSLHAHDDSYAKSIDIEIRNHLSSLVMNLLQRQEHERLYRYLVEYREFINDIMNMLQ